MSRDRSSQPTFRDIVREVGQQPTRPPMTTYRNLATEREFVDADGTTWRRRGGIIEGRGLLHALRTADVTVLHDYLGDVTAVAPEHLDAFIQAITRKTTESPHRQFYAAEFKSPDRRHLLVVHEDC
ncbi:hypothetical protein CLV35_0302 [Motilibacter peucedani]|uniref:Uncharacterized protein n=1 Tax=Motilibacter peucedani TaxID=598650 RepID=A0A420XV95_9ACTN|nr:hypothetical protein [Motilibacter peucedani]RKS80579.1 hypothetical protein CLV35_0302 [Motilibacter peucedani]